MPCPKMLMDPAGMKELGAVADGMIRFDAAQEERVGADDVDIQYLEFANA